MAITSLALHATIAPPLFAGRASPSPLFTGRAGTPGDLDVTALSRLLPSGVVPDIRQAVTAVSQDSQTVRDTLGGAEAGRPDPRQAQRDSSNDRPGSASSPPTYNAQGALQSALQSASRAVGATLNLTA